MSFLPNDYHLPQGGNYMKLQDGDNEFLILGSAILGFEYWNTENKPVRLKEKPAGMPADIRLEEDGRPEKPKHFWAFPVWNCREHAVQVLEITQKGIMGALQNLARNEKWGDPILTYTITVTRKGTGFDTEYNVVPNPKADVSEVAKEWERVKQDGFDISRLFSGDDPFQPPSQEVAEEQTPVSPRSTDGSMPVRKMPDYPQDPYEGQQSPI